MSHLTKGEKDFISQFKMIREFLTALSNPRRMSIYMLLAMRGELAVKDIQDILDIPRGSISENLRWLRRSHLITYRKDGTIFYYSAVQHNWQNIVLNLVGLFKNFEFDDHVIRPRTNQGTGDKARIESPSAYQAKKDANSEERDQESLGQNSNT